MISILNNRKQNYYLKALLYGMAISFLFFIPFIIFDNGYFLFYGDFNVQQVPFYQMCHDAVRSGNMFSVRGIGVAESVRTSTFLHSDFSFSFCATPKRCSSSIITRPKSRNFTSFETRRWVPTTISISPRFKRRIISSCCFGVRKRESSSIFTGKPSMQLHFRQ